MGERVENEIESSVLCWLQSLCRVQTITTLWSVSGSGMEKERERERAKESRPAAGCLWKSLIGGIFSNKKSIFIYFCS